MGGLNDALNLGFFGKTDPSDGPPAKSVDDTLLDIIDGKDGVEKDKETNTSKDNDRKEQE